MKKRWTSFDVYHRLPSCHLYGDDEAGDRNLNLGSAIFTVCRCNLSPGYSPILPFVIPRNVDEPPKMPPKEILCRLTVAGKRSLHHVTTFISSFQKMRTARLKCTEDPGLVLLSRNEGERVNRACIAKDAEDREIEARTSYIYRRLRSLTLSENSLRKFSTCKSVFKSIPSH